MSTIPKVIHQIWLGSEVPNHFKLFSKKWQDFHPEWEVKIWRDDDFGWLKNQNIYDNADEYVKPDGLYQFKSDIARYEILLRYGGVYMDMDTEPLKPINNLIDVSCFAVWEQKDVWIANGIMGSVQNYNFLRTIINGLEENVYDNRGKNATHLSGPRYLSRLYFENLPDMTIYPTHYFLPYMHRDITEDYAPELQEFPDSYAVHHWNHRRSVVGLPLKK